MEQRRLARRQVDGLGQTNFCRCAKNRPTSSRIRLSRFPLATTCQATWARFAHADEDLFSLCIGRARAGPIKLANTPSPF